MIAAKLHARRRQAVPAATGQTPTTLRRAPTKIAREAF